MMDVPQGNPKGIQMDDEDGIDGPFERAMGDAMAEDEARQDTDEVSGVKTAMLATKSLPELDALRLRVAVKNM